MTDEWEEPSAALGKEMGPFEALLSRTKNRLIMWRFRWLPILLWKGQEVDVRVTFKRLPLGTRHGSLADVERGLSDLGVGFDRGAGGAGRDWEWDYSLSGPISVALVGKARRPERRLARPVTRPALAVAPAEGAHRER